MTIPKDGYVYVLSNVSMPNIVKIGKTRRGGRHRAKEIYQTGVPTPFKLEFELYTNDCDDLEYYVHEELDYVRVNSAREFFKIDSYRAIDAVIRVYLSEFETTTISSEFGDIEGCLREMVSQSNVKDPSFVDILDMQAALRFIDSSYINEAMDIMKESRRVSLARRRGNIAELDNNDG